MPPARKRRKQLAPLPEGVTADAVIERMKKALGLETDSELAEYLAVDKSTVSTWRRRNSLPLEECVRVAASELTDLNAIVLGLPRSENYFNTENPIDWELMQFVLRHAEEALEELFVNAEADPRIERVRAKFVAGEYNRQAELMRQAVNLSGMNREQFLKSVKSPLSYGDE